MYLLMIDCVFQKKYGWWCSLIVTLKYFFFLFVGNQMQKTPLLLLVVQLQFLLKILKVHPLYEEETLALERSRLQVKQTIQMSQLKQYLSVSAQAPTPSVKLYAHFLQKSINLRKIKVRQEMSWIINLHLLQRLPKMSM